MKYLVDLEKKIIITDVGFPKGHLKALKAIFEKQGYEFREHHNIPTPGVSDGEYQWGVDPAGHMHSYSKKGIVVGSTPYQAAQRHANEKKQYFEHGIGPNILDPRTGGYISGPAIDYGNDDPLKKTKERYDAELKDIRDEAAELLKHSYNGWDVDIDKKGNGKYKKPKDNNWITSAKSFFMSLI
jgi:hypothetical protein